MGHVVRAEPKRTECDSAETIIQAQSIAWLIPYVYFALFILPLRVSLPRRECLRKLLAQAHAGGPASSPGFRGLRAAILGQEPNTGTRGCTHVKVYIALIAENHGPLPNRSPG